MTNSAKRIALIKVTRRYCCLFPRLRHRRVDRGRSTDTYAIKIPGYAAELAVAERQEIKASERLGSWRREPDSNHESAGRIHLKN
jgi:hypothetical protein